MVTTCRCRWNNSNPKFRFMWHFSIWVHISKCWRISAIKMVETVTNISNLLPIHFVSNICHQHLSPTFMGRNFRYVKITSGNISEFSLVPLMEFLGNCFLHKIYELNYIAMKFIFASNKLWRWYKSRRRDR